VEREGDWEPKCRSVRRRETQGKPDSALGRGRDLGRIQVEAERSGSSRAENELLKDAGSVPQGEDQANGGSEVESPAGDKAIHRNKANGARLRLWAECQGKMEEAGHLLNGKREVQLEAQGRSAVRRR
jgi:hypothetical protein